VSYLAVGWWWAQRNVDIGVIDWYTSVVWTLPLLTSVLGLLGGMRLARCSKAAAAAPPDVHPIVSDGLIVVVPTIGRPDTQLALERVVESCHRSLWAHFPGLRIDVVIDEGCEAGESISALPRAYSEVRVVEVPRAYRTPNGTRFKARANHYAHMLRIVEGEATGDVWVLHMDDDTGVGPDTAVAIARFIAEQRSAGERGLHLAQGILSFPREYARSRLVWLADAIRPGCDISLFARSTGSGSPRAGLHGELLLVRASVEGTIGWDFGPRMIVEDAQFALRFCERYPGRSGWFAGRSYGASPATVRDLARQRERWVWGLLEVATNGSVHLRQRWLLLHNVIVWTWGSFGHPVFVLLLGALLGDISPNPTHALLVPLWSLNVAFLVWMYWEGLRINAKASKDPRRQWWEPPCLLVLIPLFTLWEATGVLCGTLRFLRRAEPRFTVIAKTA
jgi:cellulose synthase/poly-beta-1,6-N-acetylglucosamine synthase-like glycosyltransferase